MMSKLIAHLLLIGISFFVGLGVMQYGWGLEIHSWGWVIGGFFWSMFTVIVIALMGAE